MKKKLKKTSSAPAVQAGPTLLEFWLALKRGETPAQAAMPAQASPAEAPTSPGAATPAAASDKPAPAGAPVAAVLRGSGGGSGSGSGGGGYGLGLIVPDEASRARIARIMQELCEQEKNCKC